MAQPGDPLATESLPPYEILHFMYGVGTYAELTILCYGKRFHIKISAENLQGDPNVESEYLSLLRKLDSDEPFEQNDDVGDPMEELSFWIAFKCNSEMRVLGSERQPQLHTLYDWFYPDTLILTPKIIDGRLNVQSSTPSQQFLQELTPNVELPSSIADFGIPVVPPSKVLLPHDTAGGDLPQRPTKQPTSVKTQIEKYQYCSVFRNSACRALSVRQRYLSSWIFKAIRNMIGKLHAAGIVWGDAKPDNILVGADDNLWIIDFGGGYTHGWVDEDKEGTMEGGSQALSRIVNFLLDKSSE
ncbi:hypothetical protein BO85DRAFT_467080 [Aspergillus piperis CBS 112811]|uniref:Protein kinase domain-containing protein n=1 Tax=Aspergillus piperis CBS 112811 TaxID=1448313 RepID=A0A8G1VP43_9EURO|nr:hypothetical protein BO85DRAFT_467080 [Aspergillus piperis CBS 112811]RAH60589.1 hypothetical protein BO85DRAFT_467080 [Aspergillus piperis CBS 112811]